MKHVNYKQISNQQCRSAHIKLHILVKLLSAYCSFEFWCSTSHYHTNNKHILTDLRAVRATCRDRFTGVLTCLRKDNTWSAGICIRWTSVNRISDNCIRSSFPTLATPTYCAVHLNSKVQLKHFSRREHVSRSTLQIWCSWE